ncbi:hypothetical protein GCM10010329_07130 [Streptomyces spiroverticillatus]|uniref:Lipoprotein n=1 Tax=Streptomyces finlayi TaxID=67296 RepID=A0A919C7V7_9ACTN|nr:hypothetical protein [Streptomyces finlayi]GGZ89333.1 hypothetical protein GCM10010329_07130 [Streptomyces spiroverticillatus]GHC80216.1 hypothetical protein GCM10010334_07120 [Streptomyces finlayi]
MPHLTRSMAAALTVAALLAGAATACTTSPQAPPLDRGAPPPSPTVKAPDPGRVLEEAARRRLGRVEAEEDSVLLDASSTGSSLNRDETMTPGKPLTADLTCAGKGSATFTLTSGRAKVSQRIDCGGDTASRVVTVELTPASKALDVHIEVTGGDQVGTAYRVRRQ